jgi:hypothetical protein
MDVCELERHGFRRTPVGDPYPTGMAMIKPLADGTELWVHTKDMGIDGDPWSNIWVAGRFSLPKAYVGIREFLILEDAFKLCCFLPDPDESRDEPTIPASIIAQMMPAPPDAEGFRYRNKPGGAHYA